MKQRIPLAILMVVLTLVCCLVGPLPRLAFLLLCGLAATWETWTILSRGHSAYVLILLGLQLLQVTVAFIPGAVVQVAAGMLYGPIGASCCAAAF